MLKFKHPKYHFLKSKFESEIIVEALKSLRHNRWLGSHVPCRHHDKAWGVQGTAKFRLFRPWMPSTAYLRMQLPSFVRAVWSSCHGSSTSSVVRLGCTSWTWDAEAWDPGSNPALGKQCSRDYPIDVHATPMLTFATKMLSGVHPNSYMNSWNR